MFHVMVPLWMQVEWVYNCIIFLCKPHKSLEHIECSCVTGTITIWWLIDLISDRYYYRYSLVYRVCKCS